ncbi:MAG: bifunctional phosphoribosylaminoimidazolecarboxamide formyltransferase/IMP cyclohydrolase [Planctomycetes bacterium]|nr:bifunctional phosphoribosylaminoimidazolecarboxamide formyltransferase/IMP cyclohydrolase [Planctomycetota bacterium]
MGIRRALLSVSDKRDIVDFARGLVDLGIEVLSTGGTAARLVEAGVPVVEVAEYTGFPEMLDGRVKTLHPKIHAGILARRDRPHDMESLAREGIGTIDLVAVNLYPFADRLRTVEGNVEEALDWIDVGGPALLRAAAKNYPHVAVVGDPDRYFTVLEELRSTGGTLSHQTRWELACEVFALTSAYDLSIAAAFGRRRTDATPFPPRFAGEYAKRADLRYGENPHQRAALYIDESDPGPSITRARVLGGKELSHNNYLDLDRAFLVAGELEGCAAVVVKHATPCGVAIDVSPDRAFERAWNADPKSAYGSVVGFNRRLDRRAAEKIAETASFVEAMLAPSFDAAAIDVLSTGPKWGTSLRLLECPGLGVESMSRPGRLRLRSITGGLLVQDADRALLADGAPEVVAGREPLPDVMADLLFAFAVAKHVASNAIVVAKDGATLGIGGGHVSRVDAVEFALAKAGERVRGAVLASDAFFPFRDSIDVAAKAGIAAIVQPGGSRRDAEVTQACKEHGITLVIARTRHFRH